MYRLATFGASCALLLSFALVNLGAFPQAGEAAPTVASASAPPPAELAAEIQALLAPQATRVTADGDTYEFWWVKAAPGSSSAPAWSGITEGTLIGALRVTGSMRDIRGQALAAGLYTLRYALQPQDGDHMGVSPYREFLLVSPAADDQGAAPVARTPLIAMAKKASRTSHPAALSIDPPEASAAPGTVVTNDEGHRSVVVRLPAAGGDGALQFGVIVQGVIEHQM